MHHLISPTGLVYVASSCWSTHTGWLQPTFVAQIAEHSQLHELYAGKLQHQRSLETPQVSTCKCLLQASSMSLRPLCFTPYCTGATVSSVAASCRGA